MDWLEGWVKGRMMKEVTWHVVQRGVGRGVSWLNVCVFLKKDGMGVRSVRR